MIKLLIGLFLGIAATAIAEDLHVNVNNTDVPASLVGDFIDLTGDLPPMRFIVAGGRDSKGIPRAFHVNEAGEVRCEK